MRVGINSKKKCQHGIKACRGGPGKVDNYKFITRVLLINDDDY